MVPASTKLPSLCNLKESILLSDHNSGPFSFFIPFSQDTDCKS